MIQDQENIYWLFSSSAQTISAFVAFLITGFALVLNVMDSLQAKDETLEEIHTKLKSDYYRKVKILAFITGFAILFSLWMVYLNGGHSSWKPILFAITAFLNVSAVSFGIIFVVSIINPNKYKKAAKEIIQEDKADFSLTGSKVDQIRFMTEFVDLERELRNILKNKSIQPIYANSSIENHSFRQIITTLYQNKLLHPMEFEDLLHINKYRNLVFHGHEQTVDKGMLDRVIKAREIVQKIKSDLVLYYSKWKSPNNEDYAPIGKLMISNKISGCGEYYVKMIALGEYLIACTGDGETWTYYKANLHKDEITKVSSEISAQLTPPNYDDIHYDDKLVNM